MFIILSSVGSMQNITSRIPNVQCQNITIVDALCRTLFWSPSGVHILKQPHGDRHDDENLPKQLPLAKSFRSIMMEAVCLIGNTLVTGEECDDKCVKG